MASDQEEKELIEQTERRFNMAKARAYSKISLGRPLTDSELEEYRKVMKQLGVEVD